MGPVTLPASPPLFSFLYVSKSLVDKDEVKRIVNQSRTNNERNGLTGGLLFTGSHFAQALEGPLPALEAKVRVIAEDNRHCQVTTISSTQLERRVYPQWGMGYINDASADGMISKLIDGSIDQQAAADLNMLLLEWISGGA